MSFFENTRKPTGLGGRIMIAMMDLGHRALAGWGLQFLEPFADASILDCGCGGGANIRRLLKTCPKGSVKGIDHSEISVERSRALNQCAIDAGRCEILKASAAKLPFEAARFDRVTAFETVYFWPDLPESFREVHRVLKPEGMFLICNECDDGKGEKWAERIDGMVVYGGAQLKTALEQAGFTGVQIHRNKKGWLCVTGRK